MQTDYILTLNSDDKPGVIETVSSIINQHSASWLESRLAHLAGKFVGVIRIRVAKDIESRLFGALSQLSEQGIYIHADKPLKINSKESLSNARFSAIGPDRTGIVKEISTALVRQGINIEELETNLSSMPYSGEPVFEARGTLSVPSHVQIKDLYEKMDAIANELGVDLDVEPLETPLDQAVSA